MTQEFATHFTVFADARQPYEICDASRPAERFLCRAPDEESALELARKYLDDGAEMIRVHRWAEKKVGRHMKWRRVVAAVIGGGA